MGKRQLAYGIWRVTIKHPRYFPTKHDVEASSEREALSQFKPLKGETITARYLRGPKGSNPNERR